MWINRMDRVRMKIKTRKVNTLNLKIKKINEFNI